MGVARRCSAEGRKEVIRVAAMSDLHCRRNSSGVLRPTFEAIAASADILVLGGDLTHFGLVEEIDVFLYEVEPALEKMPVLSVLGNHDYESGKENLIWEKLCDAGVIMLDGDFRHVCGVGFTGVKGFGGGFGDRALQPWGESTIKKFVDAAVEESDKLESGLSRLNPGPRIAILHYAPIKETVEGESPEIFPFLGSSRLEGPLNRHKATAAFHGHAHRGNCRGKTSAGIPVYNVSMAVLKQNFPGTPPYFMLEVPLK